MEAIANPCMPCFVFGPSKQSCFIGWTGAVGMIQLQNVFDPRLLIHHFAHELCHFAIGGQNVNRQADNPYSELAAEIFAFHAINEARKNFMEGNNHLPAQLLEGHIAELNHHNRVYLQTLYREGIRPLLPLTVVPGKNYDLVDSVALFVFELFEQNKNLWKILPHIGTADRDTPFEDLVSQFLLIADDSYRESLEKLIAKLYP
ncbi:MAG: hypothetical protein K2N96_09620 [Muribaculaceae bacterium]|nr:hypothetical protein [Muribaculaceae bacterium]